MFSWQKHNFIFKFIIRKGALQGALLSLQIHLYPLHRLNHILAMPKRRQPEEPFPAWPETAAGGASHVAFGEEIVEERKDQVSARRNSIKMHTKSQPTIPLKPPYGHFFPSPVAGSH